jgi:hypothetical protein
MLFATFISLFLAASASGEPPPGAPANSPEGSQREHPRVLAKLRHASEFDPAVHGFACPNRYEGSPLPPTLRGMGGENEFIPREFGLCGGMSLAAADFFLSRVPVPGDTDPPASGTALYDYFYQRQVDSLGGLGVMSMKFLKWMSLPDESATEDSAGGLTADELPSIVSRLKAGQLVPIGLVYQSVGTGKLWDNHQVLAFAVDEAPDLTLLRVYDPNYPKDGKVVLQVTTRTMTEGDASKTIARSLLVTGNGRKKTVRGLFAMPYSPKEPVTGAAANEEPADERADEPAEKLGTRPPDAGSPKPESR